MSSPTIANLNFISQQITIYLGTGILIAGVIGACLNILVFLSLRTFRENSCAFYLTVTSAFNIGQLITGLLRQILITGFGIDGTQSSLLYCKWRPFCFQACMLISLTNMCLATIDQYCATSSRPRWQQWCNIKFARLSSGISVIIWHLHAVLYLIYMNHVVMPTGIVVCKNTNDIFQQYINYVLTSIIGRAIPLSILFSFGLLAYCNVKQLTYRTVPIVRRELDKQLTTMVLVQVFITCITILPAFIVNAIQLYTNLGTDPLIAARLQLASILTICLYYIYFAVSLNSFDIYYYCLVNFL